MKSRWWNIFDAMVEMVFKPAAGGYVYRAPSLWPFVSDGHYIVNEVQKAALTARHLRMFRALFWLIIAGAAISGPLAGAFLANSLWMALGTGGLVGLTIGLGANTWLVRKIRPIIADLEPTRERITQADLLRAQAKVYSKRTLIGFLVLDVVMLLLAGSVFITGPSGQYGVGWLGVLFFGGCTIYTAVLYMAKRTQSLTVPR